MASTKKTLDPRTQTPENKTDVTKRFMELYMETVASPADVDWFFALIEKPENRKMYTNKLNGEKYEDIDIPKVRQQFCARFYPNLNSVKKTKLSFTDRIKLLRDAKNQLDT